MADEISLRLEGGSRIRFIADTDKPFKMHVIGKATVDVEYEI